MEKDVFDSFPDTGETKTELDKVKAERDYWKQTAEKYRQHHNLWVVKMTRVCEECKVCAQTCDKTGLKFMENASIKEDERPEELQSVDMVKQAEEFEKYKVYYRNLRKQFTPEELEQYGFEENPKKYNDLMYAYNGLMAIRDQKNDWRITEADYRKNLSAGTLKDAYGTIYGKKDENIINNCNNEQKAYENGRTGESLFGNK